MLKVFFVCLSALLIASCHTRNNHLPLRAAMESLENSNKQVKDDCNVIFYTMQNRLKDPTTAEIAGKWYPQAETINKLSEELTKYIEGLKTKLKKEANKKVNDADTLDESNENAVTTIFEKQNEAATLSEKIRMYREAALNEIVPAAIFDSVIIHYLKKDTARLRSSLPEGVRSANAAPYFKNTNALNALVMLSKYQNDVLLSQHLLLYHVFTRTTGHTPHWTKYSALAVLNSSYLKRGQTLEVIAGMGAMTNENKPTITINGKVIPIGPDGVATLKFAVNNKPGKYFIPVEVEFTQSDGTKSRVVRKLEYIVAE